jgi:AraC-like DNA-binding protein
VEQRDDVARLISRHAGEGVTETALPGVSIMRSESTTEALGHIARPSLAFVIGGAKNAWLAGQPFHYRAGQYLVIGVELPITAHISEASPANPFLGFGIDLTAETVASLLLDAGPAGTAAEKPPLGLAVSDVDGELLDAIARLLGLLDRKEDMPGLFPAYKREILWRVLTGPQGGLVRQIGLTGGRLTMVARAIRFIREHYDEAITIEGLAQLSAMSPATLHRHFRVVTSMTPIQFQKQLRLQEARRLLIGDPDDVAGAGFAVGYESASQFNREYRRMFGMPPGRDAQAFRRAVTAAVPVV